MDIPITTEAGRLATYIEQELTSMLGGKPSDGGCRTFYSPEEWRERGESYGRDSVLIVVHDGGDYAHAFNFDYGNWELRDQINAALAEAGYYAESCTSWYTAIYPSEVEGKFKQSERGSQYEVTKLMRDQGWNSYSTSNLMLEFIKSNGLLPQLQSFLEEQAKLENGE
jgi:hypothetical protein